jgi:phosphohistidine phosphatase
MEVYILRHGIAEKMGSDGSDAERALTPKGRQKLRQVLRLVRAAAVRPSVILTSPLVRAVQTAEVAAEMFAHHHELVRTTALLPTASPQDVWQELRSRKNEPELLLVGHEPLLSQVVGYLLGTPGLRVDLKKAGLIRIRLERFTPAPSGILKWVLTPKLAPLQLPVPK